MSGKRVIIDTDILSLFAKVDAVDILEQFLGIGQIALTPAIRDEISIPLQYGYTFPNLILSRISVAPLREQAWQEYERLRTLSSALGKGELEAIAICKAEGILFATNDSTARRFAQDQGVEVVSLQAILRGLWQSGLRNIAEVKELLTHIKQADYLEVPSEVEMEIFGEDG